MRPEILQDRADFLRRATKREIEMPGYRKW